MNKLLITTILLTSLFIILICKQLFKEKKPESNDKLEAFDVGGSLTCK